jgi:hypothetical protein
MVCGFDMKWVLEGQIRYHRQVFRYTMGRVSINHGFGRGSINMGLEGGQTRYHWQVVQHTIDRGFMFHPILMRFVSLN